MGSLGQPKFWVFSLVYAVVLLVSDGFRGKLDMLMEERCVIVTA